MTVRFEHQPTPSSLSNTNTAIWCGSCFFLHFFASMLWVTFTFLWPLFEVLLYPPSNKTGEGEVLHSPVVISFKGSALVWLHLRCIGDRRIYPSKLRILESHRRRSFSAKLFLSIHHHRPVCCLNLSQHSSAPIFVNHLQGLVQYLFLNSELHLF